MRAKILIVDAVQRERHTPTALSVLCKPTLATFRLSHFLAVCFRLSVTRRHYLWSHTSFVAKQIR